MMYCTKPNMTNLKGKAGKEILFEIRNSKVPSHKRLFNTVRKQEEAILAERGKMK